MAAITIRDLHVNRSLDRRAMASIRGAGGAPWVFGWMSAFTDSGVHRSGNVFNVVNQFFIADQMNFQNQITDVFNTGANAMLTVGSNQAGSNAR